MKHEQHNGEIHLVFEKEDVAFLTLYGDIVAKQMRDGLDMAEFTSREQEFVTTAAEGASDFEPSEEHVQYLIHAINHLHDSGMKINPVELVRRAVRTYAFGLGAEAAYLSELNAEERAADAASDTQETRNIFVPEAVAS